MLFETFTQEIYKPYSLQSWHQLESAVLLLWFCADLNHGIYMLKYCGWGRKSLDSDQSVFQVEANRVTTVVHSLPLLSSTFHSILELRNEKDRACVRGPLRPRSQRIQVHFFFSRCSP